MQVATAAPRTRFAPSPTGDLHLGGAWTALASWVTARHGGGTFVLRIEDLDTARTVRGSEDRIKEDLLWLGLDWSEEPVRQSDRGAIYEQAVATLAAQGLVYPCDCSRAEIAASASAPHEGEEMRYPGICRDRNPSRAMKRPPALRVRVPEGIVTYDDGAFGRVVQDLAKEVGDFVLRRADGIFAYQLAVAVDDAAMRISHVVRGADLIASTPRQLWLANRLAVTPPSYTHVPLVLGPDGARLEKRTRRATVRELRDGGVPAQSILGALAHGLGLAKASAPASAVEIALAAAERPLSWLTRPWPIPTRW
jgi:glutamyl-tRNA synthetase